MKIKSIEIIASSEAQSAWTGSTEPLLRWVTNIDEPSLDIEVIGVQQASSSRSKQGFFAKEYT